MVKLSYDQPSLKKYGTMKEMTLNLSGSTNAIPANDTRNEGTSNGPDRGDPNSTFD